MTDKQPEALRLAQELESHLILDCMTHVQNPAENEHVAGDVSKNEAELNMSAQQEVQEPVAHVLVPYYTVEEVFDASLTPQPAPAPLNLNCKSTQKRLATLWGFVPAGAQEPCAAYAALPPNELRTNYLDLLQEVLDAKDVMLAAGCQQDSFGAMFAEYSAPRGQAPAQPCMAKQSPHPEYGKGFSDGWDRCEARQAAELDEVKTVCAQAYQVVGILLSEAGRFDSPEAEKILDNLGEQRLRHTDVLPWESKAAPQQEAQEPAAWMTQEGDRVVTEKTMNAARRGGGAMLTSLHSYSVALVRAAAPQPSPVAQGDAEDAARYRWLREHSLAAGQGSITVELDDRANGHFSRSIFLAELDAAIDAARSAGGQKP